MGEVAGVFTQPDRAVGRGQKIVPNAIKTWAIARGLPVFQPDKLTEEVRLELANQAADLALVMAYGHILKDAFIATPRLGTLNLHASILPKYRGASPIQTAIASGETETGVSLMRIVRKLDAGPVADVERVPILPRDTALEIEKKLSYASIPLLARTLPRLRDGLLNFLMQDESQASFCRRLVKEDGQLDFTSSAKELAARINGLFPWPSCVVEILGQPIKIGLAEALEDSHGGQPGEILTATDANTVAVATGRGTLRLLRLQRPGGKMLGAADFLRGFSIPAGTRLACQPMAALVSTTPFKSQGS
jgi:methionyl-tRNA formyltransferase